MYVELVDYYRNGTVLTYDCWTFGLFYVIIFDLFLMLTFESVLRTLVWCSSCPAVWRFCGPDVHVYKLFCAFLGLIIDVKVPAVLSIR